MKMTIKMTVHPFFPIKLEWKSGRVRHSAVFETVDAAISAARDRFGADAEITVKGGANSPEARLMRA